MAGLARPRTAVTVVAGGSSVGEWLLRLARATPLELLVGDRVADVATRHHALMVRWNRVHNLTRVLDAEAVARAHWMDGLMAADRLERQAGRPDRVVDVGSGAGFPGLCLAVLWPECEVTLLEPARKRVSFLRRVRAELQLDNVRVLAARIEDVESEHVESAHLWPAVVSRATFQPELVSRLSKVVSPGGWLGALVATSDEAEWSAMATAVGLVDAALLPYEVPGLARRHILFGRRPP